MYVWKKFRENWYKNKNQKVINFSEASFVRKQVAKRVLRSKWQMVYQSMKYGTTKRLVRGKERKKKVSISYTPNNKNVLYTVTYLYSKLYQL
jgi:hypothetical protein